ECSGPGQGSGVDLITPSRAAKVVHDYWSVNEQALMTYNTGLFGKVQASPLLDSQMADVKAARAAGDPALKSARPLTKVTTYVPDPKQMPGSLARYLNSGISSGSPEGPFAPGHLTTDAVTSLRRYRDSMAKLGYAVEVKYQPAQFFDAYKGVDGRAVVLFN